MSKQPKAANKTNIKRKTKAKTEKVLKAIRHKDRTHSQIQIRIQLQIQIQTQT